MLAPGVGSSNKRARFQNVVTRVIKLKLGTTISDKDGFNEAQRMLN